MKAWLLLIVPMLTLAPAHAQLLLRVSIKQVLDQNGNLPMSGIFTNQDNATDAIAEANGYLDRAGFGYRLQLTDYTLVNNVTLNGGAPSWNLPPSRQNVGLIEDYALTNAYGWRTDAVNIYITQGTGTFIGYCSFPGDRRSTILLFSGGGRSRGQLLLHEVGHFYSLGHVFDCCSCCDRTANPACSHTFNASGPSATGITDDLLPDLNCIVPVPDEIATNRFGRIVADLTPDEFRLFSITYSNLMSYHSQTFLLSDRQKEMWAITANAARANTATGQTRFVANFDFVWGAGGATSLSLPTVTDGINAANPGDVIMILAGSYREPQVFSKPVTLRASRGWVTIAPR